VTSGPPDQALDVQLLAAVVAKRERHELALVRHCRRADEQPPLGHVADLAAAAERPCLELCLDCGANASLCHAARFGSASSSICEIRHIARDFPITSYWLQQ